jgi:uncharacterized protein YqjF (DUF2071 family)
MSFLTARWTDLCLITYAVPPAVLEPRLPPGLQLDTRDGQAFVSLVAFQFRDTRVLGVAWPGCRDFAELNLRFYVRDGTRRGVVFIREFVPLRFVAWVARLVYNEPYRAAPLQHRVVASGDRVAAECRLFWAGKPHRLAVEGQTPPIAAATSSDEHFFKEHQWGFGVNRRGRTLSYRVDHPCWEIYPVVSWKVELDWASVYGPEFRFLQKEQPCSVVFAAGSGVCVSW